jgi:hypothetical protein
MASPSEEQILQKQNRSPDFRIFELRPPSQGPRLSGIAAGILRDYSCGAVADFHRASHSFCFGLMVDAASGGGYG